jgi:hypothetical protein
MCVVSDKNLLASIQAASDGCPNRWSSSWSNLLGKEDIIVIVVIIRMMVVREGDARKRRGDTHR